MKIGIDISVLQTGHRKRGVGYTLINFINHLPEQAKRDHEFVLFMYKPKEGQEDPLQLLQLKNLSFETRIIKPFKKSTLRLPGKTRIINNLINYFRIRRDVYFGDTRIKPAKDLDWFFQFDQHQSLPTRHKVKSTLILYDLIQYIMEADYLPTYSTARLKGHSRKGALRLHLRRRSYISKLRIITRKASRLVAISEHTKQDFVRILKINPNKISITLLGVEPLRKARQSAVPQLKHYVSTSWGYLLKSFSLSNKKFLLFVGGADPRRRLVDLVAAFNNLRAQGHDIKLVLAGDTMLGAFMVPHLELQEYLKHTSYLDDIHFVGFVNDAQRDWLYQNALAFVYPSLYEGFGLPILEAMQYGTPVVSYNNSSISEISGDAAIIVNDYYNIVEVVNKLLTDTEQYKRLVSAGKKQAAKFSWQETSRAIFETTRL